MPPVAKPWFRMYSSILTNSKVQSLRGKEALIWINLLALANLQKPRGQLPALDEMAFQLRMSIKSLNTVLNDFADIELIDDLGNGVLVIHDWNEWQAERDVTTARRDDTGANAEESSRLNHAMRDDDHANVTLTSRNKIDSVSESHARERERERVEREEEKEGEGERAPDGADTLPFEPEPPKRARRSSMADVEAKLPVLKIDHPSIDVQREFSKAADWLKSSGKRKQDHEAFFRNWLRRCEDDEPRETQQRTRTIGRSPVYADVGEAFEARL